MDSLRTEINNIENDLEKAYVIARSQVKTDKAGFDNAGFSKGTFYSWPEERRSYLNSLARRLNTEVAIHIMMRLQEMGIKAVEVKGTGLDSRNEQIRQRVSTEVLEWLIGKPTQKIDQKTEHSGTVVVVNWEEEEREE